MWDRLKDSLNNAGSRASGLGGCMICQNTRKTSLLTEEIARASGPHTCWQFFELRL